MPAARAQMAVQVREHHLFKLHRNGGLALVAAS